jgi:hypothetical protein
VSLSELDSRGYELRIHGGSMEVFRGDMVIIWGIRRGDLYEMGRYGGVRVHCRID